MIIFLLALILFALFLPCLFRLITGVVGAAFIYLIISAAAHTREIEAPPPRYYSMEEPPPHADLPTRLQTTGNHPMKKSHISAAALSMLATPVLADAPPEPQSHILSPTVNGAAIPASPVATKARVDTAIAAYDEAVTDYVKLQNKAARLEATETKTQIKSRLTGDAIKHSPEAQATYDAKDIAEAKMNATEAIMNAAIADMGGNK
jgi:hypothetical protein